MTETMFRRFDRRLKGFQESRQKLETLNKAFEIRKKKSLNMASRNDNSQKRA